MQSNNFDTSIDGAQLKTEDGFIKTEPIDPLDSDQSEYFPQQSHRDPAEYILPDLTVPNNKIQVDFIKSEPLEHEKCNSNQNCGKLKVNQCVLSEKVKCEQGQCSKEVASEGTRSGGISTDPHVLVRVFYGYKSYTCQLCQYKTTNSSHMRNHQTTHSGARPYQCNLCSFSFKQAGHLKTHKATHTVVRPFKCDVCSYCCIRASDLKKHMFKHSKDRPYKCTLCSFNCRQTSYLKRHMATHSGQRPFKCSVCLLSFIQAGQHNAHMKKHSGVKPFSCEQCEYKTTQKCSLVRHVHTHISPK